jgi:membrane dipeptidase
MTVSTFPPIFDGHNDTVMKLMKQGTSFFEANQGWHIDLPKSRAGGLGGGFFAVYISDPEVMQIQLDAEAAGRDPMQAMREHFEAVKDRTEWPDPMPLDYAQSHALAMLGRLLNIERNSDGACKVVRTAGELQTCLDTGVFAILLHFEGAEPLDSDGRALEVFYAAGLRSVGLTHSRRNIYTEGVPFTFGRSPDTGPGLNELGKELVRQLNAKRVMIDLSHITERGFWDVAELTDAPLVATHSNAWELCKMPRNLTDRQLRAIGETRGVAGLNFMTAFLAADGSAESALPLGVMVDHIDSMVEKAGIDCVAFGSDFDGALVSDELGDASGLPKLMQALKGRGYSNDELMKLAHANWVRVLRETWGE